MNQLTRIEKFNSQPENLLSSDRLTPFHDFCGSVTHKITDVRFKETGKRLSDLSKHSNDNFFLFVSCGPFNNISLGEKRVGYFDQALVQVTSPLGEFVLGLETSRNGHTGTVERVGVSREVQTQLASLGYTVPIDYLGHDGFHSRGDTRVPGLTDITVVKQTVLYPDGETQDLLTQNFKQFDDRSLSLTQPSEDVLHPSAIARFDREANIVYVSRVAKSHEASVDRSEKLAARSFE